MKFEKVQIIGILATIDIGLFGTHWMMRWHQSDADIPDKSMMGKPLADTKEENGLSEFYRRILQKPKYEDLIVEPRIERHIRGAGLQGLLEQ